MAEPDLARLLSRINPSRVEIVTEQDALKIHSMTDVGLLKTLQQADVDSKRCGEAASALFAQRLGDAELGAYGVTAGRAGRSGHGGRYLSRGEARAPRARWLEGSRKPPDAGGSGKIQVDWL